MSIIHENEYLKDSAIDIAKKMLVAARTAPKGKGRDTLEMMILHGEAIENLSKGMKKFGKKHNASFFTRDAKNLKSALAVVIIGTRIKTLGLDEMCQLCGFENCKEKNKHPNTPCVFNTGDLNIAIGAAAETASQYHVDNRIMFSIGKAALEMNLFESDVKIALGIPISITSKNPFFDRK